MMPQIHSPSPGPRGPVSLLVNMTRQNLHKHAGAHTLSCLTELYLRFYKSQITPSFNSQKLNVACNLCLRLGPLFKDMFLDVFCAYILECLLLIRPPWSHRRRPRVQHRNPGTAPCHVLRVARPAHLRGVGSLICSVSM